jgi:hypothetical protein
MLVSVACKLTTAMLYSFLHFGSLLRLPHSPNVVSASLGMPVREDNSARDAVTHKSVGKAETSQSTVPIQKRMERQNVEYQVTGPGQGMTRSALGVTFLLLVSQVHLMVRTVWENVISSHNWLDISTESRIYGLKSRSHCYSHCIAHQQSVAI